MNDESSLASSYYEIIENLSVIWEETSQDLRSIVTSHSTIVTNPKHRSRLGNGSLPYAPSSPRLSPRSVEGKMRTMNLRKSPLLKKNVLTLSPAPISELEETEEDKNNGRGSVFVTSLRTGELIALPLQDDEYTFESCTTGSDMQSVDSIEEYVADEGPTTKTRSRRQEREEPTEDEAIFEIVDELKEELLMIKHARDEAMKALYLQESSSPSKTQRLEVSGSDEQFLSRRSTTTKAPQLGNIFEVIDSSSLPDILPSSKETSQKIVPITSRNAPAAITISLPPPAGSSVNDSNLPETDSKDDSSVTQTADALNHISLPDASSMIDTNTQQVKERVSQEGGEPTFKTVCHAAKNGALEPSHRTPTALECNGVAVSAVDNVDVTLHSQSTLDSATQNEARSETSTIGTDSGVSSLEPPIDAPITIVEQESKTSDTETTQPKGSNTTPPTNFALMKKRLQSNFESSFFDVELRLKFRVRVDSLAGQRRRVQYNSSRLLLKRRLRKLLKEQTRISPIQTLPDALSSFRSNDEDNDSIDIPIANPQDDFQEDCNNLQGRHRRFGRSNRRRSESDLRRIGRREEKRAELRSKVHSIEDKLERIRMNLSSSLSSIPSLESDNSEDLTPTAVGERQRPKRGLAARSFSEGMISADSPQNERLALRGRLERIRVEKKLSLEKLQCALDSAMEAIAAEAEL